MLSAALFAGSSIALGIAVALGAVRARHLRRTRLLNRTVRIAPLSSPDMPALEGTLAGTSATQLHDMLDRQARAESSMYVAWQDGRPVGVASVCWDGPRHAEARAWLKTCPEIHSVHVDANFRSGGVGSRLIATCEGIIVSRGFQRIGAEVEVDNTDAYALWLRAGYAEPHRIEYDAPASGASAAPRRLRFLVKSLVTP